MGTITISENVSLDGVVEDPTGGEGFRHGGWFNQISDADRAAWAALELAEAQRAEALLLGRRSDEFFGSRWSSRTGEWADRLNALPKYVVSSTLAKPAWTNATILRGDVVQAVRQLKRERDGEIVVYGSRQLVQTLLEHGLADELRLVVVPVVLGDGERWFGPTTDTTPLRLTESRRIGTGLVSLAYEVVHG
jgi:dihydrofolate reductase